MDRKEFLSAMLALGGTALASSATASTSSAVLEELERLSRRAKGRIDPAKCIIMSDIHICGEFDQEGKPRHYPYNPICFAQHAKEILSIRPLPANLIILGDIAWDYGHESDYRYVAQLFEPLEQAGIKITVAMGNHDRRQTFLRQFPEYQQQTQVAERVVSVVELPYVDFIVLDSLDQLSDEKANVAGAMDAAQLEWLKEYLASSKRPAILSAHHPMTDLRGVEGVIAASKNVVGYIYGHLHIWDKGVRIIRPLAPQRMVPSITIPSTFYGDIGYAVMECDSEGATINYSSSGFWWPQPVENPPKEWAQRQADLKREKCRILFR